LILKIGQKKLDSEGNPIINNDDNPVLEQRYSVDTGTVLNINTKDKKLYDETGDNELVDLSSSFTPQKKEFMKAGWIICDRLWKEAPKFCMQNT
jgi:aconitate hydratase 2/2-methylisocitrate dehydratase